MPATVRPRSSSREGRFFATDSLESPCYARRQSFLKFTVFDMTDAKFLRRPALALALGLGLAFPALAQDAAPAAPAAPAAAAPAAPAADAAAPAAAPAQDGVGSTYTAATFGDWEQRCVRTKDGTDPCQMYQLLKDDKGNSVAEFTLFGLPAGQKAAAGATIMTPLETLLTEAIVMKVDDAQPKRYGFTFCAQVGCIAQVGFTQAEVDGLKKGKAASLQITPVAAPDHKVNLKLSLNGFTAAYDAVNKANADSVLKPKN